MRGRLGLPCIYVLYHSRQIIPAWKKIIEQRRADIELNFGDIMFTEFFPDPKDGSIIAMQNLCTFGYRNVCVKVICITRIS